MSGHSKWATIKRKKGAIDAARGKTFTKLAREIQVAARGSADLTSNFALRLAVDKAKAENMPKDNIERAIRRGAGLEKDGVMIENIRYEGYAPHGIAVLIDCLTDNRNRTISDLRQVFTRGNGNLGEPGSVAWQFSEQGYIVFDRFDEDGGKLPVDAENIFMVALDAGAKDVIENDDSVEIYTERSELALVNQVLAEQRLTPSRSELMMKPNTTIALGANEASQVLEFVDALDELDDVNQVFHNLELTDEIMAQFA